MLCLESFDSRCRRIERRRYWVLDRSVWRIDSLRFMVWFELLLLAGEEARSSMFSI